MVPNTLCNEHASGKILYVFHSARVQDFLQASYLEMDI